MAYEWETATIYFYILIYISLHAMIQSKIDLTSCDKEPIHILGKIQAYGFLIAVNSKTLLISYISENIGSYIKEYAQNYLGKHIDDLEKKLKLSILGSNLKLSQILSLGKSKGLETINPFNLELDKSPYNFIITVSGNEYLLEFEPAGLDVDFNVLNTIGRSVSKILSDVSLSSLVKNAAREIKKIIGYDRIMIYKFGEDGHGEVIAEERNKDFEPFLGLHYPASDIPKQARELYKINLTRIIADVNSENSLIATNQGEDIPLDLTNSVLRAVSPMHIQYLKNMGVASSFSISLISHGELWGLIACHNYSPKFISYKVREASKLIGQIVSSALEFRQGEEDSEKFAAFNEASNILTSYIGKENDIVGALTNNSVTIKDITSATGAVLVFDETMTCIGLTPDDEQILAIVKWLKENMQNSIFYTHSFPALFEPAKQYSHLASGVMACMLSGELSEMIIWFKPEQIERINWAGNPEKPVEQSVDGSLQLSPRKSFESWTEIVKHTSEKWNRAEMAIVVHIREQIVDAIRRKANEIRILNERLKIAYEELDTFSYTVSHDLRMPLSAIKSYTELLLTINTSVDENAKTILERISVCSDKMTFLTKEILNYSRVSRSDIRVDKIDMTSMIHEIKADVLESLRPINIEFTIGDTPDIYGDAVMIGQAFSNLINNAVKYSSKSNPAKVKVEGVTNNNEIIYSISDNGVGIDEKYYNLVFELFKRLDNAKDTEGTGVGLAIVKRIIDKHSARIWLESSLGKGTVFYLSFENK
jgi:chemotaxis family two-component system sensor kinase Cph1